jgi:hypothetical protein
MAPLETKSKTMVTMTKGNCWKMEALKRAKLDAEKGEFISHQAMGEWVISLGTDNELPAPEVDIFKKRKIFNK